MKYDDLGNCTETVYLGTNGKPCFNKTEGIAIKKVKRNTEGNKITTSYFDPDDKPILSSYGVHIRESEFDTQGNEIVVSYFDPEGKSCICQSGYAIIKKEYDNRKNIISSAYFDVNGKPYLTKSTGCALVKRVFDERSNEIMESFFDTNNKPCPTKEGVAIIRWEYDSRNNKASQSYFGTDDKPILKKNGCAVIKYEYDERNNKISESYYGIDGKLLANTQDVAIVYWKFDERGNKIEESYLDADEKPSLHKETNFSKCKWEYDDDGKMVCHSFYGIDGMPCLSFGELSVIKVEYDERGNEKALYCFGVDGKPCIIKWGFSIIKHEYDERGNNVEGSYFGTDGKPCLDNEGTFKYKFEHDARGNRISNTSFGIDGNLTINKFFGCALIKQEYDEKNNETLKSFFGTDGKPCLNKEGIASEKYEYDVRGNKTKESYFGVDGQPCLCKDGVSFEKIEYDTRGNEIQKSYYGTDGKPCLHNKKGYSTIKREFNEKGDKSSESYFGTDGKPCLDNEGVAVRKYTYTPNANAKIECYDLNGTVVKPKPKSNEKKDKQSKHSKNNMKQYTIEQFMKTVRIGGAAFSPNGREILYYNNQSGIFNVYAISIDGGTPQQLTHSTKESTFSVDYLPDGRFLYRYDRGGNENEHLYLLNGGQERDLTPGEKVKAFFLGWNQDESAFYYMTNGRDPKFFDLFKMDAKTFTSALMYEDTMGYQFGRISRDEKWIAFTKINTTADSDIYLYDISTKAMKHISPHEGEVTYHPADFDVESKNLYYLTDDGSEFKYLARYDLTTGKKETVEKANWDIQYAYFSKQGKYRVLAVNEDAHTRISIIETQSGKAVPLPKLPNGDITGVTISDDEKLMAFYFNGDRSPSNLFVYDFATGTAKKLTDSLNPEIATDDLVESEVVRFKSFDGMTIPNILYRPHGASVTNPAPALVWVHGGPGGQTRTGYSALIQFLVNHGYVVLGINNRGSSGYGKTFFTADDRKHGREPLWDCVEAKTYLKSLGYVDPNKIGIIGGSYGGYMTLAALAFKPEEFNVGVDIFGVSNWIRTLESIPPYWESFRKALYKEVGDPVNDRQMLMEVSPLFHADKITRPLMVLQGANDPRVIKSESDDIVSAIQKKGGVVEYVLFDNEGHGFSKKENEIAGYQAILKFLDKYLKGNNNSAEVITQ